MIRKKPASLMNYLAESTSSQSAYRATVFQRKLKLYDMLAAFLIIYTRVSHMVPVIKHEGILKNS